MRPATIVISAVLFLCAVPTLYAQAHRSIVLGQVTDTTGAAIPDADISVIQKSTNAVRTTQTNESGHYEVPGLLPDTYRVEARHPGFKTVIVDDVAVTSGRTVEIDLQATLGEVREVVTVVADKQMLDVA